MKVPLHWLLEFVDLPTTDVAELSHVLDMLGHKVEGVESLSVPWTGVLTGRVVEVAAHPDADRIRVCQVDTGSGPTQIICGAWNFESGAAVAVAQPGAVLPGGFEIGVRDIRGIASNGMICSERELGLGEDHEGILVLDEIPGLGVPFENLLELPDSVFDLEITSNRPDAMSIHGIARDLAAYFRIECRLPPVDLEPSQSTSSFLVDIEDPEGCRRFTLREINDVTVGRSPLWLRHRLSKVGVRPISNVVDVTNYVMFELGHPLHAFDGASVVGQRLSVRRASPGETLETLDHVVRALDEEDLIIYDESGPTSMSGTMGGARSEVTPETTTVLMEAASWDAPTIMRMSRRHDLRSEASARFERGVDPGLADLANQRASALVASLSAGTVLGGAIDVVTGDIDPRQIEFTAAEVERVLGPGIGEDEIVSILTGLGMGVEGGQPMMVTVPTYRPDVTRPIDLVEEVARLHGYERFGATVPTGRSGRLTPEQRRLRRVMTTLVGAGLNQAINLPFVGIEDVEALDLPSHDLLTVRNPLREEESKLRPSLLPGLLRSLRHNLAYGSRTVGLFEVGSVFGVEPAALDPRLPEQPERLAWAVVGEVGPRLIDDDALEADGSVSLGLWRLLTRSLGITSEITAASPPGFHPGRTAEVRLDGVVIGHVGELAPAAGRHYGIADRVAVAEVDLEGLLRATPPKKASSPSIYPHVDFDLSFLLDEGSTASALLEVTIEAAGSMLERAVVFDEFRSEALGAGRKALAITYRIRAGDRTLTAEEIAELRRAMIEAAEASGAELRGA